VLTFHITIFVTPKLKQELHDFNPFHTIPLKEMLTIFKQHPFHSSGRLSLAWLLNMCFNWLFFQLMLILLLKRLRNSNASWTLLTWMMDVFIEHTDLQAWALAYF
jgi:hypothetical protein